MTKKFDRKKFENMILYFADKSRGDSNFGAVKLNKLMFLADFTSYGLTGEPISGAKYIHLPQGPGPSEMGPVRKQMENRGDLRVEKDLGFGFTRHVPIAISSVDPNVLTERDRKICDMALRDLAECTGTRASLISHGWLGWINTTMKEEIPYYTVFSMVPNPITRADIEWGEASLARLKQA